ncbi:MAG: glycosyltransferase family 4 protein, partial [Coraliomargarita sp.]
SEAAIFMNPDKPQIYCLTQREIDTYHQHYGTALERFHLLPPGVARVERPISEKSAIRASLRSELGVAEEQVVALFVGSDYKRKGVMRNLEALKSLKDQGEDLELWVLGADKPGPYEAFAKQHDLRVRFLGGRSDVARFYDAADFMLHPAHSESAGKVLIEALTYGLPVVVSGICGYSKQVGDSGGGVVLEEPFDQMELNKVVLSIFSSSERRKALAAKAINYAINADIYSCTSRFAQMIEEG